MSSRDTKPKKKSRPKLVLEPISIDEILSGPGMSGFVSILEPREEVPHLQALVDDIQGPGIRSIGQGPRLVGGRKQKAPGIEREPEVEKAPEIARDPGVERDTGHSAATPLPQPKPVRPAVAQRHVRRAVLAQDGHSSGEEMLYQALWNSKYARQETKETKLVTIGWKAMAKMARMTPRNTKRNCQSLIDKLALEQLSDENSRESIGRTYRVFSYKSILERRRAAGMEWITRTRGVEFVSPPADLPMDPAWTVRKAPVRVAEPTDHEKRWSVPPAERGPGVERDTGVEGDTGVGAVVRALREYLPGVDDASAADLVGACRQKAPDASADELAYFVRLKADLMFRMGTVKSPMGFLKTAVPRCFEGESFRQYRETEARRREAAQREEAAREEEERRFREEQQAIANDPKASDEERRIAREYLGLS